jgi:hypothetical protein
MLLTLIALCTDTTFCTAAGGYLHIELLEIFTALLEISNALLKILVTFLLILIILLLMLITLL